MLGLRRNREGVPMTPAPLEYRPAPARVERRAPVAVLPVTGHGIGRALDSLLGLACLNTTFFVVAWLWCIPALVEVI